MPVLRPFAYRGREIQVAAAKWTRISANLSRLAGDYFRLCISVQHVAFSSNDIFQTAHALADRRFSSLQISANYYKDLRARFGLDDAMIRNLRAFNILYDRDDAGEYFQLYSPLFGEGFFLEIVQRTGAYSGYGAPNAIFRIASQRQLLNLAAVVNAAAL